MRLRARVRLAVVIPRERKLTRQLAVPLSDRQRVILKPFLSP